MRQETELRIFHTFRDGSHDPSKKTVPPEIVAKIHEIRLRAEANARKLALAESKEGGIDA